MLYTVYTVLKKVVGLGSNEQVEGYRCMHYSSKNICSSLRQRGSVKRQGSCTFCITKIRSNLSFLILSLKKAANFSHFDVEMMKEWLLGAGFMRLSIVEKSILGLP